ncbi:MAG TPA: serine/threonine-protein kinase, partial [Kofleriaceae bacterium]
MRQQPPHPIRLTVFISCSMADRDLAGRTLGEYILREQIGEGGHAVVYRAEQPALQRDVVVKVLHERRGRSDASRERFLREAKLASRLDHPYAAHVYDSGAEDEDGLLWIAMERVHGVTFREWLKTRGPMPLDQFVPLFECVAQVVQAAHEDGIVHRDLKPSNIMVIERGGRLFPKLLDFGIAKLTPELAPAMPASPPGGSLAESREPDGAPVEPHHGHRTQTNPEFVGSSASSSGEEDRLTPSGVYIGSMAYMSPEQWTNAKAVGPAADIYSLGVVVYQALTGRVPFDGAISREARNLHCFATVPPLVPGVSSPLDRVIQRALAKDPQARHRDVLELASELRAVLRATAREQIRTSAQQ